MRAENTTNSLQDLVGIMRSLRHSETGCPWDIVQTFKTIAPYTIEEAYEVSDAINRQNMSDLCEELGDLLLQVIYHSQMAAEENHFTIDDVIAKICEKMISRHPHVFGSDEEKRLGKNDWEEHKKREWQAKGKEQDTSYLANVTEGLSPMLRAKKLQKKAAKANFDWPSKVGVLNKLDEEINELKQAIQSEDNDSVEEELGDLLFTIINLSRHVKIDADIALQKANAKFENRFRKMEALAVQAGYKFSELSDDQLDGLWCESKSIEKSTA